MPLVPVDAASPSPGPWQAARLLSAPHRLSFFAAAVLMALTAAWWLAALAARAAGIALPWAVPPPVAHGLTMALAFMPLFMVGFLYTAGPRWLGVPDVPVRALQGPLLAMGLGWALALPGFHLAATLAAAGLCVVATAWLALLSRFARLIAASRAPDQLHARAVLVACGIGALAMTLGVAGVGWAHSPLARTAALLAVWGFLAPVFTIVSHRMLPFFTASALPMHPTWRPNALLGAMLGVIGVSAASEVAAVWWWSLPTAVHALLTLVQGLAAVFMLWLALRWGLLHSLKVRLLAMLHGGFVWFGVALALLAASHGLVAWRGGGAGLGLAPLHALTMGFLGATLLAMVTRVTAGHSGRPLAADNVVWTLYLVLQAAAVLRVVAAAWPASPTAVTLLAASGWALACGGWAWRYGGWLGRPRVDGRPG